MDGRLAISGNEFGLQLHEWNALSEDDKRIRRERAYRRMLQSGAHYTADTIADLMPCIDDIGRGVGHPAHSGDSRSRVHR